MSRRSFILLVGALVLAGGLQSFAHLWEVILHSRLNTQFDLDRNNGVPDVVSTFAIGAAALGAGVFASRAHGRLRRLGGALAAVLAMVALEDTLHDHPGSASLADSITSVTAVAGLTLFALLLLDPGGGGRSRATLTVGLLAIAGSLAVGALPDIDQWFERARGDPIIEYQIVLKQGLELAGWWLVAIALWDKALHVPSVRGLSAGHLGDSMIGSRTGG